MTRGAKTMAPKGKKEQGVALFQTLLIAAMLALIAIGFSQRTQDHVHQAQRLEDRTRAMLLAHSAMQDALFVLLTESEPPPEAKPCGEGDGNNTAPERGFNRYGAPFCLEGGAKVIIQDLSGLLPVAYPDHPLWPRFLQEVGLDEDEARAVLGTLRDFQDRDQRSYIPGTMEPGALSSGRPYPNALAQRASLLGDLFPDKDEHELVKSLAHIKGQAEVNPLLAPDVLLRTLFGEELGLTVSNQRRKGALKLETVRGYFTDSGDPEALIFTEKGSPMVKISAYAKINETEMAQTLTVNLALQAAPPLEVLSYSKY